MPRGRVRTQTQDGINEVPVVVEGTVRVLESTTSVKSECCCAKFDWVGDSVTLELELRDSGERVMNREIWICKDPAYTEYYMEAIVRSTTLGQASKEHVALMMDDISNGVYRDGMVNITGVV